MVKQLVYLLSEGEKPTYVQPLRLQSCTAQRKNLRQTICVHVILNFLEGTYFYIQSFILQL
jgi:hypothetical protein